MSKRKGEDSQATIDLRWPHQVAIQDDLCVMENFATIVAYLDKVPARTRKVHARWEDGHVETYRVYCFKTVEDAASFMDQFGGVQFDPKWRKGGSRGDVWRRSGPYVRYLASGPLRVPPIPF